MIIAIGDSCRVKQWRNQETTWEEFLDKVRNTRRTSETMAKFMAMSKDEQLRVKVDGEYCYDDSRSKQHG